MEILLFIAVILIFIKPELLGSLICLAIICGIATVGLSLLGSLLSGLFAILPGILLIGGGLFIICAMSNKK